MRPSEAAAALVIVVSDKVRNVDQQAVARFPRAANALRNAEIEVLTNPPGSKPGKPPGMRTGTLRRDWTIFNGDHLFGIESGVNYSSYLEHGTSKMAPRPFVDRIVERAQPEITRIFDEIGGS